LDEKNHMHIHLENYNVIHKQKMKDKFDSSNNYILNEYLGNKYERYKAIYFDNNVKKIISDLENNLSLKHIDNTMNIFKSNSIFL